MDIIHIKPQDKKWYFWDEVWAHEHGPYESEEECERALVEYAKWLDGYELVQDD